MSLAGVLITGRESGRLEPWHTWVAESGPVLITALGVGHWRVRMTAIQTIGRLSIEGVTPQLLDRLNDEHARVRSAAILALDRVGTEEAVQQLLRQPVTGGERARADRAVARILERADRS